MCVCGLMCNKCVTKKKFFKRMSKGIVLVTFGRLIVKPHILVKDLQLRKCVRYPS